MRLGLTRVGANATLYGLRPPRPHSDRKSTRLNSSHVSISYAVFCLKKTNGLRPVAAAQGLGAAGEHSCVPHLREPHSLRVAAPLQLALARGIARSQRAMS